MQRNTIPSYFAFLLTGHEGKFLGSKLMGTMAERGNGEEDQVSFCVSFFFF